MERLTLNTSPITGIVLRYGMFYGSDITYAQAERGLVRAAAHAALLAVEQGEHGIYNITDDTGYASIHNAGAVLGYVPQLRL